MLKQAFLIIKLLLSRIMPICRRFRLICSLLMRLYIVLRLLLWNCRLIFVKVLIMILLGFQSGFLIRLIVRRLLKPVLLLRLWRLLFQIRKIKRAIPTRQKERRSSLFCSFEKSAQLPT